MECWPNPPPRGIRWGKVERRAVQRMLSTPWTFFKTGHWRGVDPAQLKLDVLAAAAFGFLGREEGDVKALARFELTTRNASKALFVGSRFALLGMQFQEQGSGRIGTLSSWKRSPRKFVCRFDDGSGEELGVSALFGNIVKSLEGGVVLCGKTEVDVLNWYKGEKRRRSGKKEGPRGLKRGGLRMRGDGVSGFFGVKKTPSGRWRVDLMVDRKQMHIGTCDEKEDAARLVDIISVVVNREAPENFPELVQDFLDAGGHGDVPTELVEAALRRDGDVDVAGAVSDGAAEALDALAAAEKEIEDARDHRLAFKELSDSEVPKRHPNSRSIEPTLGATATQVKVMEEAKDGPEDLYDLALIDVDIKQLALAMTKGTCSSYTSARRTLWRWKHAAAALLDVKLAWDPPPKNGIGKNVSKEERSPAHQRALDVASRWVAHAGTPDLALVKDYADALAAIARRQLPKKSSGGDGVAKPPQKKQHC